MFIVISPGTVCTTHFKNRVLYIFFSSAVDDDDNNKRRVMCGALLYKKMYAKTIEVEEVEAYEDTFHKRSNRFNNY